MLEDFIKIIKNKEEEILMGICRKILKREPEITDAKRLTKIYRDGEPLNYSLAFDGVVVGNFTFIQIGCEFTVTFQPC